jgi:hypothetical protein
MSPADADELRQLDAAVDRIFKAVPEHPYILSVPCDEPRYHYPSLQEAQSWQKNTPFSLDEERLQYMSFLYREPSETCFVVRSQVDEERDRLAALKKQNGMSSSPSTPLLKSAAKNKISFGAYKAKLSGKPTMSPEKPTGEMTKMEAKPVNGFAADVKPVQSTDTSQNHIMSRPKR